MKKSITRTLGILGTTLVAGGVGLYMFMQSKLPAREERISRRNAKVIGDIDDQLEGVDIDAVKAKAQFIEQKSVEEIKKALENKDITCQELVAYYLINIKEKDQSETGNNAISEINPDAMEEAKKFDENPGDGMLAGIPVLVKDNINTDDMPTSAGTYALRDFVPEKNAPVVDNLIKNGAIILGKTNMSELAYYMSRKNPSGYSGKKGQTHNPFRPVGLSPLGSSTGSAVAMATDLAATSLGTETCGSIVAPASVNSVVGYKPTRGSLSIEGVVPLSHSLDTVGPIAKTVKDALLTYNAASDTKIDMNLDKDAIKGKKIGILAEDRKFDQELEEKLIALGAEPILLVGSPVKVDVKFILKNDFEHDLNSYLEKNGAPIKSLEELIEYNKRDESVRMRYGQSYLEEAVGVEREDWRVKQIIQVARNGVNELIQVYRLDALVAKNQSYAELPAVAGGPEVTVPFGMIDYKPAGATFFGKENEDEKILNIAYSFEQHTEMRQIPPDLQNDRFYRG